ncbi:hypothetical protein [Pseudarthrobacter albicanus]|uniref:hypothetical protein n=1 Tax=Pseudarthrobacter albicanus TaxID=2823873 RepID=UPI001BA6B421|nr:hypothetical protein [Pseudarthrobacter albicanus]
MDPDLEKRIEEFSQGATTAPEPSADVMESAVPAVQRPARSKSVAKEPTSVGFNFKMTPTDHMRLKAVCAKEERSIQYILNKIVWPVIADLEKE